MSWILPASALTGESLDLVRRALAAGGSLAKAGWIAPTSATSGINYYDLEVPVKQLFPIDTPLRDRIPRAKAPGGTQANWRAITGINSGHQSPGVSEGNRNAVVNHTTADYFAAFRELGEEDNLTWKAEYTAEGFADLKALVVDNLLRATMVSEELIDLGGNTSLALGTTPTPTLAASTTGGTLGSHTYSVICVALTNDGYIQLAGINMGTTGEAFSAATAALTAVFNRTTANGASDSYGGGVAQKSANATVAVTGATGSMTATVTPVVGAVAYAWYWGQSAGSEVLGAVTTINSILITADSTGTQNATALPSSDNSENGYVYDGIITQLSKGLGSYYKALATGTAGTGTPLTSDGAGGIVELNAMFRSMYDLYRLSPDTLYVSSQEMTNINAKIIAGGGAPLFRYNLDVTGQNDIIGGVVIAGLINKITGKKVMLRVHPNMPPGTIVAYSDLIPYPLSGVRQVLRKLLRYDYRALEWPMVTRRYEWGVYFDGVLQNYFPPAFGLITNIGNG
jgi:hypothetical protein